jgi:hypothetical protein
VEFTIFVMLCDSKSLPDVDGIACNVIQMTPCIASQVRSSSRDLFTFSFQFRISFQ